MNTDAQPDGRRRRSLWKGPGCVALLALAVLWGASRVVDGWHWPPAAFFVVSGLIFAVGLAYQLVTRNRDSLAYRGAVGMTCVSCFMLTWSSFVQMADLTPFAAMYFTVPVVGLVGTAVARLRPKGMARVLFVMALTQAVAWTSMAVHLTGRKPQGGLWTGPELRGLFGNAVLVGVFVTAALLFGRARRAEVTAGKV